MTAPLRRTEPTVVPVALGERAYDIVIGRGLLAGLGERIKNLRPAARVAIVTDETVARHHLAATEAALKAAGIDGTRIVVPAGEGSKSFATFEKVCEAIIAALGSEGLLAVGWSQARAVDLLWTLMSIYNWEQLTVESGWAQVDYIAHMKMICKRTFVKA